MTAVGNTGDGPGFQRALHSLVYRVRESLSALSFWFAIAIPAIYVPLLFAGIESARGLLLFLGLLGLHVIALIGGRGHAGTDP